MTGLNLRKNTAQLLKLSAEAIENAKAPNMSTVSAKLSEYRIRAAALMMPNDIAFVIESKTEV
jgi:hypothetical protein